MQPGDKVRLIANPGRVGVLGSETDGPPHRLRLLVNFLDGEEQFFPAGALEKVEKSKSIVNQAIPRSWCTLFQMFLKANSTSHLKRRFSHER